MLVESKLPILVGLIVQVIVVEAVPVTVAEIFSGRLRCESPLVGVTTRLAPVETMKVRVPTAPDGLSKERTPICTGLVVGAAEGAEYVSVAIVPKVLATAVEMTAEPAVGCLLIS
ncbi:MAG: hypothetical protein ACD_39C00301G0001 [uncultured bacterium]|nr:MAG: hypothetical protein ACD_39C00301G0001 [uncultured bacterium]